MSTPPSWYPDPAGSGLLRWWDGAQWTEQLEQVPAAQPAEKAPSRRSHVEATHAAPVTDPDTLWQATGKPLTGVGVGRYRLTAKYLFFEKGTLHSRSQQVPIHELYDVDASQSFQQKARGLGTITLTVRRAAGDERVSIEDVPDHREGVRAINAAAHAERERLQVRASTSTVQYEGVHPAAASAQAATGGGDPIVLLERLGKLRDAGVVTDEEFEAKKADLLSRL